MTKKFWMPGWALMAIEYPTEVQDLSPEEEAALILFMHKHKLDGYATFHSTDSEEFRWGNDVQPDVGGMCYETEEWRPDSQPYTATLADHLHEASDAAVRIVLDKLDVILHENTRPAADRERMFTTYEAELPDGSLYAANSQGEEVWE